MTDFIEQILVSQSHIYIIRLLGVFAVVFLLLFMARQVAARIIWKRFSLTDAGETLLDIVRSIRVYFLAFLAALAALQTVSLPEQLLEVANVIGVIVVTAQVVYTASLVLSFILYTRIARGKSDTAKSAVSVLTKILTAFLWVLGFMFVLGNLGIDTTSLIAGLGIGGIAIAFALQGILSDLFSSFAIYFDRPFEVGDFIQVGDKAGVVKHIGIKTTRLELLRGEELVVTNQELASGQVQNFGKLSERREVLQFGVLYETAREKLKQIPEIVQGVVEATETVRFDRAHFATFGDSALVFEVVYYVEDDGYDTYMDAQQEINFGILRAFDAEGIEMAYPTTTVYVKNNA